MDSSRDAHRRSATGRQLHVDRVTDVGAELRERRPLDEHRPRRRGPVASALRYAADSLPLEPRKREEHEVAGAPVLEQTGAYDPSRLGIDHAGDASCRLHGVRRKRLRAKRRARKGTFVAARVERPQHEGTSARDHAHDGDADGDREDDEHRPPGARPQVADDLPDAGRAHQVAASRASISRRKS